MDLHMSKKQFRRLLDLVYIGNWILNSMRENDRITEYDEVESLIFGECRNCGMERLVQRYEGQLIPSMEFADGGIHEAILDYEDNCFFEILAQEMALRDMGDPPVSEENSQEIMERMREYLLDFQQNGTDHVSVDLD